MPAADFPSSAPSRPSRTVAHVAESVAVTVAWAVADSHRSSRSLSARVGYLLSGLSSFPRSRRVGPACVIPVAVEKDLIIQTQARQSPARPFKIFISKGRGVRRYDALRLRGSNADELEVL